MDKILNLSYRVYVGLINSSVAAYSNECCGLLSGHKDFLKIEKFFTVDNQAVKASTKFYLDPIIVYKIEREIENFGEDIVGIYHSHTDCAAVLSEEDEKCMIPGLIYVVLSVISGEFKDMKFYIKRNFEERALNVSARIEQR